MSNVVWRLPAWRLGRRNVGECIDALGERFDSFELHILLVSHLKQESFYPGETLCDWLDDGGDDGLNFSTGSRFGHSRAVSLGRLECDARRLA
jgi:hypothetical protein